MPRWSPRPAARPAPVLAAFLFLSAVSALYGDELTLQINGGSYVALSATSALAAGSTQASGAQLFDRLYAGNGYFYLRAHGGNYVAANATTGALSATATTTLGAEQFLAATVTGTTHQTLQARASGNYVVVDSSNGNALEATAATWQATAAAAFVVTATADATPFVALDRTNPRQEIVGFGGAIAFYNGWLTAHPNQEAIYRLLFDREDGLGASFLASRTTTPTRERPTPTAQSSPLSTPTPSRRHGAPRSIAARPSRFCCLRGLRPPRSRRAARKAAPAPALTPAAAGQEERRLRLLRLRPVHPRLGRGLSRPWRRLHLRQHSERTRLDPNYGGCRFNPTEATANGGNYASYSLAIDATYQQLQKLDNPPALIGPETVGIGYGTVESFIAAINPAEMGAFAHHLYSGDATQPDTFDPTMNLLNQSAPSTLPMFETEFYLTGGLDEAWMIHNAMAAEEDSVYLHWGLFWPLPDTTNLVSIDNPWNAPSTWSNPNGYVVNDQYYGMKHFSRFIQPGFRRIASFTGNAEMRVSAYFDEQEHRLVYVLINTSSTDTLTPAILPAPSVNSTTSVYRSVFSGTTERFAFKGPLGAGATVSLPPQSVATVVIDGVDRLGVPEPRFPSPWAAR